MSRLASDLGGDLGRPGNRLLSDLGTWVDLGTVAACGRAGGGCEFGASASKGTRCRRSQGGSAVAVASEPPGMDGGCRRPPKGISGDKAATVGRGVGGRLLLAGQQATGLQAAGRTGRTSTSTSTAGPGQGRLGEARWWCGNLSEDLGTCPSSAGRSMGLEHLHVCSSHQQGRGQGPGGAVGHGRPGAMRMTLQWHFEGRVLGRWLPGGFQPARSKLCGGARAIDHRGCGPGGVGQAQLPSHPRQMWLFASPRLPGEGGTAGGCGCWRLLRDAEARTRCCRPP